LFVFCFFFCFLFLLNIDILQKTYTAEIYK
jgi:hypothetical protein